MNVFCVLHFALDFQPGQLLSSCLSFDSNFSPAVSNSVAYIKKLVCLWSVSLFICLFVYLTFTCYCHYMLSVFTVLISYGFVTYSLLSSIPTIISYFIFAPVHWGEFKILSLSDMVYPYPSVVWVNRLR